MPGKVQEAMDRFGALVGRHYHLFDYVGDPEAERVVILMGSAIGAAEETMRSLREDGEKVGVLKVRLYRPFDAGAFLAALPKTVKGIAVLDRTKEPGALGEPLYQDVVTVLAEGAIAGTLPLPGLPQVIGGRYGLSSKEFTPAMAKAVFDELKAAEPRRHFTVGIEDDVTHLSLAYDPAWHPKAEHEVRAVFFGLGSRRHGGGQQELGEDHRREHPHVRPGLLRVRLQEVGVDDGFPPALRAASRIEGSYLIDRAGFVACHHFGLLDRVDVLGQAEPGAIFLLNSPYGPEEVWERLPVEVQRQIIDKKLKFYVVDGYAVAEAAGLGRRVNTVLQTCFFALSKILPPDEAIREIKAFIKKSYGRRGEAVLKRNYDAVDASLAALHQVEVPAAVAGEERRRSPVPADAPEFVQKVTGEIIAGRGELLPVSAFPPDGTFPTGTTKYEKRSIALEIPIWDPAICIDCARCALVCPHASIRIKYYDPAVLKSAPEGFLSREPKGKDFPGMLLTVQVAPEDCTGCGVCVSICPAKSKEEVKHKAINMEPKDPHLERERERYEFFLTIPEVDRSKVDPSSLKGSQALLPLFEYSGACAGCGETPYIKLASQLFGDRMLIGNATGCTSIYGGNLPTTPWTTNADGKGPAWSNSLFEDAAEFAFGMRLAADQKLEAATAAIKALAGIIGDDLVKATVEADQTTEQGIYEQRARVAAIRQRLAKEKSTEAKWALGLLDALVRKSIWGMGGDGWAYDIGFGGLDHVLASGRDINLLVLDTEVYSNTGGQASKSTYRGAVARFASGGKPTAKKDLGLIAMSYGDVYVAQVAMGANMTQTVKAFVEAESYHGPSLIIAYSPCIAHGIDMAEQMEHQKEAVASGYTQLYRYDPRLATTGGNPLQLDSRPPTMPVREFTMKEARFAMLTRSKPERAEALRRGGAAGRGRAAAPVRGAGRGQAGHSRGGREGMSVNLETSYLGMTLSSPLVVAPSPLGRRVSNLLRLQEAGAAAVVLPSLFEEQIEHDSYQMHAVLEAGAGVYQEAARGYLPEAAEGYGSGSERYLALVREARDKLTIPVIASLNGISAGGWVEYARKMEEAGASALELNVYFIAADAEESGEQVERRYLDLVTAVRAAVGIPAGGQGGALLLLDGPHGPPPGRGGGRRPGALQPLLSAGHRHRGSQGPPPTCS